jgi:hypothetical protein
MLPPRDARRLRRQIMEHLWSPGVAAGRNPFQIRADQGSVKHLPAVASACHRSPPEAHGKEGVNSFESVRGLCKSAARRRFCVRVDLQVQPRAVGMEPIMELSRRRGARPRETNAV